MGAAETVGGLAPGQLVGGKYAIVRLLGEGGMGVVYEATQVDLGRRVALKVLHPHLSSEPTVVARFKREAEAAAALGHANIVQVTDFGFRAGEGAFLVMEFLRGASLGWTLAREGALAPGRAAFIVRQVLAALEAAHAAGIVHRDLKPDNVFLTEVAGVGDVVKLLDFGIAKLRDADGAGASSPRLTQTGAVLGTPSYMSPEQARGRAVDARTDLYSAGVMLFEALTGRVPFAAENYNALLFSILEDPVPSIAALRPGVEAGLITIVERAMARDPNARFQSAAEFRAALSPYASIGAASEGAYASPAAYAPAHTPSPFGLDSTMAATPAGPAIPPTHNALALSATALSPSSAAALPPTHPSASSGGPSLVAAQTAPTTKSSGGAWRIPVAVVLGGGLALGGVELYSITRRPAASRDVARVDRERGASASDDLRARMREERAADWALRGAGSVVRDEARAALASAMPAASASVEPPKVSAAPSASVAALHRAPPSHSSGRSQSGSGTVTVGADPIAPARGLFGTTGPVRYDVRVTGGTLARLRSDDIRQRLAPRMGMVNACAMSARERAPEWFADLRLGLDDEGIVRAVLPHGDTTVARPLWVACMRRVMSNTPLGAGAGAHEIIVSFRMTAR